MTDVEKKRGSNNAPSSHPLRDVIIKMFDGTVLEEARRKENTSNEKPSWKSLLNKMKKD